MSRAPSRLFDGRRNPSTKNVCGANGSGKSTLKSELRDELVTNYVNADEILLALRSSHGLDLNALSIFANHDELADYFAQSTLIEKARLHGQVGRVSLVDNVIHLATSEGEAYIASVIADFLRRKLVDAHRSFSFETVMSSPDKVEFLRSAQAAGYRTYLYFVATEDPQINISRVKNRFLLGGHDVPEEKIRARYFRTLKLLPAAIRSANRAYIFDNSRENTQRVWIAEFEDSNKLELKTSQIPHWFNQSVLRQLASE